MGRERNAQFVQQQAVAAWIDYLNQLRLNQLLEKLFSQDTNLESALAELQKTKNVIISLIENNRGGTKGIHGFIAEAAESGIGNAKNLVKGLEEVYKWINNNGPVDLRRGAVDIQQKFVRAGGHFGLEAIKEHIDTYPDFLKGGGKYQIPKDFYDELKKVWMLSEEEAAKETKETRRLWEWVHKFFKENEVKFSDIEPASLDYGQVQAGKIENTLKEAEQAIKDQDQKIRDAAYRASKPNMKQAAQVAGVAAALEGGLAFCLGVGRKLKQGKRLSDFNAQDWKDLGVDTSKGAAKGGIRGAAVYGLSNFTATPAEIASALVTATFGILAQARRLQNGDIGAEEFVANSEVICLEVSVSALSSILGQIVIPVPVLGVIIGNTVGMFLYQIAKDHLSDKEQQLIQNYRQSISTLEKSLEEQYHKVLEEINAEFEKYSSAVEIAFDEDVNRAFEGSIELALDAGVSKDEMLKNKQDIDNYFLN